ncbi:MAG TPA: hypothetical protein VH025_08700, partial [Solirubrobacteraceae bacterium]|nr:hypothetical protein [Solirubrobacteraceae bacterium]
MTDEPRDPWRTPTLRRLGAHLRVLEGSSEPESDPRTPLWRRRSLLGYGGAVAAAAVVVVVLQSGSPARAITVINRAPAAAARSISVAFRSVTTV